jgi:hypothetical protein
VRIRWGSVLYLEIPGLAMNWGFVVVWASVAGSIDKKIMVISIFGTL